MQRKLRLINCRIIDRRVHVADSRWWAVGEPKLTDSGFCCHFRFSQLSLLIDCQFCHLSSPQCSRPGAPLRHSAAAEKPDVTFRRWDSSRTQCQHIHPQHNEPWGTSVPAQDMTQVTQSLSLPMVCAVKTMPSPSSPGRNIPLKNCI